MKIHTAIVDKGYKGAAVDGVSILRPGLKRGITRAMRRMIRKRSAIEARISHMKNKSKLGKNRLRGEIGDAIHAVLCVAGYSFRLLIKKFWLFCTQILLLRQQVFFAELFQKQQRFF